MKTLKSIFNFELIKVINRRNTIGFLLIVAILQIFLQVGKISYNDVIESKKTFQILEQKKASRYIHYRQYGTFGIWIKFIPSSTLILFNDSTLENFVCNLNSTWVLNAYTPKKGRELLVDRSRFLNFSVFFILIGGLVCLIYGMITAVKKEYLKFVSTSTFSITKAFCCIVLVKLIIIFLASIALFSISILPLIIFDGINLFITSFPLILGMILLVFFLFSVGYLIGLIRLLFSRAVALASVYFSMLLIFPWVLGLYSQISSKDLQPLIQYDFQNFEILMHDEDVMVTKHGILQTAVPRDESINDYRLLMGKMKKNFRDNEERLKSDTLKKIKAKQTIACFIPTLFYLSICENISSAGDLSIIDYQSFCIEKREKFAEFITDKTFQDEKVENFIKGDNNCFYATPKLPHFFWLGVFLSLAYILGLLFVSYRIEKKRLKIKETTINPQIDVNPGFVLCENEETKQKIFNFFETQSNTACLEKIDTADFMFKITPMDLLRHLCQVSGVSMEKVKENLSLLGIRDLNGFKINHELVMKIYAAVLTATDYETLVINDFLLNEPRGVELAFFKLLSEIRERGKIIIYLSCQMKATGTSFDDYVKVQGFKDFPLELDNSITLR